uniref:NAC domain-containing protein n=1 Tax=Fagus sylvatica TaxID=28930 RepID=A0A2N9HXQ4_FAGSY
MTSMESMLRVGYRFHPTDEELINHYLKLKMLGKDSQVRDIAEVNICKLEPWELPGKSAIKSDDSEWYFFSPRELKYSNGKQSKRATQSGYWKITGKVKNIKAKGTNKVIGTKKFLVFYTGRVPVGKKTSWVMHEYQPEPATPSHQALMFCYYPFSLQFFFKLRVRQSDLPKAFVICRLKIKTDEKNNVATCDEGDVSSYAASDLEIQMPWDTIPEEPSFGESAFTGLNGMQDANQQEGDYFIKALLDADLISFGGLSSDTDTDTAQVAASSSLFNDQVGRTEYRQMRMVNNGTVCQYKEERNDFISDDIFGLDTSSVDSAADYPRGSSESPQSIRTTKPQHQQRSRAAPRKFQPKMNSIKVVSQDKAKDTSRHSFTTDLPKKEKPKVPAKELKLAVGTSQGQGQCPYTEKIPKPEKDVSTGSDRKAKNEAIPFALLQSANIYAKERKRGVWWWAFKCTYTC